MNLPCRGRGRYWGCGANNTARTPSLRTLEHPSTAERARHRFFASPLLTGGREGGCVLLLLAKDGRNPEPKLLACLGYHRPPAERVRHGGCAFTNDSSLSYCCEVTFPVWRRWRPWVTAVCAVPIRLLHAPACCRARVCVDLAGWPPHCRQWNDRRSLKEPARLHLGCARMLRWRALACQISNKTDCGTEDVLARE